VAELSLQKPVYGSASGNARGDVIVSDNMKIYPTSFNIENL